MRPFNQPAKFASIGDRQKQKSAPETRTGSYGNPYQNQSAGPSDRPKTLQKTYILGETVLVLIPVLLLYLGRGWMNCEPHI